jgi:thermitase
MNSFLNLRATVFAVLVIPFTLLTNCPALFNNIRAEAFDDAHYPAIEAMGKSQVSESGQEKMIPNDPYLDKQWALESIHLSAAQFLPAQGSEPLIAVLDTGIDSHHPDLAGKIAASVNFTGSPTADDINGHGTHVAGIIAAGTNNGIGIAGIAPDSRLLNVKVAEDDGSCRASVVAQGIIWAVNHGAKIINISLELGPSPELEKAAAYAWEKGSLIIAAAGNDADAKPVYPAHYTHCVAVAATQENGELAPLSNYGDWIDAAAPGYLIFSTLPGNNYGYENGTSSAAACVSGLAALLINNLPDTNKNGRTNDELRDFIIANCRTVDYPEIGHGIIDAAFWAVLEQH